MNEQELKAIQMIGDILGGLSPQAARRVFIYSRGLWEEQTGVVVDTTGAEASGNFIADGSQPGVRELHGNPGYQRAVRAL